MNQYTLAVWFPGALLLLLLTLKLADVLTWSWWWITTPVWLPTVLMLGFLAAVAVIGVVKPNGRFSLDQRRPPGGTVRLGGLRANDPR
ncbi:hypothetical protein ACL02S_23220 [Nocardia sp. 004]|uniref:hypothetical protein n=1 Tax=Nocardia sp. 004 TaxID=3385978 RepID=UPI0039A120D6